MSGVVGIDLSLTGTGVARIDRNETTVELIRSKGVKGASIEDRANRLTLIANQLARHFDMHTLVVIEQPAYSQTAGAHHDRSGLWWLVVSLALGKLATVVEVTPGGLKKYATGKGNAGKDEVLAAVVRRYPTVPVGDNNTADALVLGAMGARFLGYPIEESLPALQLKAMEAVRWES